MAKSRQNRTIANSMLNKVPGTDLVYSVHYFHIDDQDVFGNSLRSDSSSRFHGDEENEALAGTKPEHKQDSMHLTEMILKMKLVLKDAFHNIDTGGKGAISKAVWADVMQHTLKVNIRWLALVPVLVPPSCLTKDLSSGEDWIRYLMFLDALEEKRETGSTSSSVATKQTDLNGSEISLDFRASTGSESDVESTLVIRQDDPADEMQAAVVEALYPCSKQLEIVFRYFDRDLDGFITKDEFIKGCEVVNATLPQKDQLTNLDRVYGLMDIKGNGDLDVNLFFEVHRLSDGLLNNPSSELGASRKWASLSGSLATSIEIMPLFDSPASPLSPTSSFRRSSSTEALTIQSVRRSSSGVVAEFEMDEIGINIDAINTGSDKIASAQIDI